MVERYNSIKEYHYIVNQIDNLFMGPIRTPNKTPKLVGPALAEAKRLIRFKIGDSFIYARNQKEAIKRAKKRGLWREGINIEEV